MMKEINIEKVFYSIGSQLEQLGIDGDKIGEIFINALNYADPSGNWTMDIERLVVQ